ncbi:hypothetical protein [Halioglobus sp. HI00S01]|uniref:hypothetical protein n=1 Tax=Halioglobus sp. HI00S01 TaxID=1822214 RepID=UPI0008241ABD|nr:hypothetical protein [Halioglobus sp. HI00S01]
MLTKADAGFLQFSRSKFGAFRRHFAIAAQREMRALYKAALLIHEQYYSLDRSARWPFICAVIPDEQSREFVWGELSRGSLGRRLSGRICSPRKRTFHQVEATGMTCKSRTFKDPILGFSIDFNSEAFTVSWETQFGTYAELSRSVYGRSLLYALDRFEWGTKGGDGGVVRDAATGEAVMWWGPGGLAEMQRNSTAPIGFLRYMKARKRVQELEELGAVVIPDTGGKVLIRSMDNVAHNSIERLFVQKPESKKSKPKASSSFFRLVASEGYGALVDCSCERRPNRAAARLENHVPPSTDSPLAWTGNSSNCEEGPIFVREGEVAEGVAREARRRRLDDSVDHYTDQVALSL